MQGEPAERRRSRETPRRPGEEEEEITRLAVERGEAERVELQYQLTVSRRDADRVTELSRAKHTLTERVSELQQKVEELQRVVDITRQAREEDQHALQQEVEECYTLLQNATSENQRLQQLLQEQQEALEESKKRMKEVQKEREKEAEVIKRQAEELKHLMEREERSRREKELSDQKVRSVEANMEAERAAHLESKFNSDIIQLRVRDLEAALAVERSSQQEAQVSLEVLRGQFREVERAASLERERSGSTERTLERLQNEYEQCKSELSVALETEMKMTSDLTDKLEEEERQHANTHSLLEEAVRKQFDTEEAHTNCMKQIRETLQQRCSTGYSSPAKDDGKQSCCAAILELLKMKLSSFQQRVEKTDKQVQDLLHVSERLQQENQTLQQVNASHRKHTQELKEEVTRLCQENSDWSIKSCSLTTDLEREREEREREREERGREREEREREREERMAEVQKIIEHYQKESKACLSFLYRLYQRLLAGCPHSILGNFTWKELCDVITEQADQLTSDLRKANDHIAHLQGECEEKSVCVRELQRSQECVLSRLEEVVKNKEEAWSVQHTHTVTQLQLCRSQCDSLQGHVSSLTSDLSKLQRLLAQSQEESACFLSACMLLAGALTHTHHRVHTLCRQKALLSRRLEEQEALEQEVRRLASALEGEEEEKEEETGRRRRAARRWRRSICVALAVKRWCVLAKRSLVLFRVETGGGGGVVSVCVCGGAATTVTWSGHLLPGKGEEGREGACLQWLRSKNLSSTILSSMANLQGALACTGSSPPDVMSAARAGLSCLLEHILNQSEVASSPSLITEDGDASVHGEKHPPPNRKALVSTLQQHFLLFSQRLHSAEVERRSLRKELRRAARGERVQRQEREEACSTVPAECFQRVCEELRQTLNREQQAHTLLQQHNTQLHTHRRTQHTLSQTTQSLLEAQQEVNRKERSLRILGKHLSGLQRDRKQLEERLQRAEDELRNAARCKECLISCMQAAERSYKQVWESFIQSRHSPLPLPLPRVHLEPSGAESIMGAPEVASCQSFLSTFSQLYHTLSSRIEWLEQEVSAFRSHVTALRSDLQDICLRDNLAYVSEVDFPPASPLVELDALPPKPISGLSKDEPAGLSTASSPPNTASSVELPISPELNPASSVSNPAPSCHVSKPRQSKPKEKKMLKKNRHLQSRGAGRLR
ncbi:hypothetical protein LDENG_00232420 [Lucifuga dentata]|nr:hypothetical protein LDENG_00232420 [Lucifuga dentata]